MSLVNRPKQLARVIALPSRLRQITALVASGYTNRDIADALQIAEQTVRNHLSHIYDAVGVRNRTELAMLVSWPNVRIALIT